MEINNEYKPGDLKRYQEDQDQDTMDIECHSQPTLQDSSNGIEEIQFEQGTKEFRPRRAKWACFACHKRKVRCDALNQGTSCTNCKLDMKECIAPPRRRKKTAPSPYIPGEARTVHTPLSPTVSQSSVISDPQCRVQSNSTGVTSRKRKSDARSLDSHTNLKGQRPDEVSSHNVKNAVGRWMDMLPPKVLQQLELHSTKDIPRPRRDIDGLNVDHFHDKCSEKLLQAVDILTEVIIMHNSLSAHTGFSIPIADPATGSCASEKQLEAKRKENMECSPPISDQIGGDRWDIENTVDESLALTPESLEYVSESNFNIWLELNDFDLENPVLGVYDAEKAGP